MNATNTVHTGEGRTWDRMRKEMLMSRTTWPVKDEDRDWRDVPLFNARDKQDTGRCG